jgi:hypothetical protein
MSVQLPPNSTGSVVDTYQATTGKERQYVALGDPTTGANLVTAESIANSGVGQVGALIVANPATWSKTSTPASATQATVTQAAGGAGVYHVCRSISFALAVDGTHAQTAIQINLRDGGTGAGTVLWALTILKAATEAISMFHFGDLNIAALTANNPMTLEFSVAGVTGSVQSVSLTGYDI